MDAFNPPRLACHVRTLSPQAVSVELDGEIDMATADQVRACFAEIASQGPTDLIIDATRVGFIDSTGLHALIEGKRLVHEAGGRIALVPSEQVRRLFELALPQPVFETRVDTVGDAYASLGLEAPA